jgi:hypothetical protein
MSYRQDGVKQERVESVGLTLEDASAKFHELFNPLVKEGWAIDRYEVDDGRYRNFELIDLKKSPIESITIEVNSTKEDEPVVLDVAPTEIFTIEPESSKTTEEVVDTEFKSKVARREEEPFCRCLYEIDNNLPVSNYCEMSCKDQFKILQKRKQEKRLKESESSTGSKSCE